MESNDAVVDGDEGLLYCVIAQGVEGRLTASPHSQGGAWHQTERPGEKGSIST